MADEPKVDPQGKSTEQPQAPSTQADGQAEPKKTENQEIPEKYQGKSTAELARELVELGKVFGKHTEEVSRTRDQLAQWESLGKVLEANPALYKLVEEEIDKTSGRSDSPQKETPKPDDTRVATENILINNFEKQFGIDNLPTEKRSEMHQKIGAELADMLDPKGKKSVKEVLDSIPLDRLPIYLEKAYKLAAVGDDKEKIRMEALIQARQDSQASFGNIPSSSVNNSKVELTEAERKVARRMNISEEKYLKNKLELQ